MVHFFVVVSAIDKEIAQVETIIFVLLKGLVAPVGEATAIAIDRVIDQKLPEPYSSCVGDIENYNSKLTKLLIKEGYAYQQNECFAVYLVSIFIFLTSNSQ
jgi:hypothetical protein